MHESHRPRLVPVPIIVAPLLGLAWPGLAAVNLNAAGSVESDSCSLGGPGNNDGIVEPGETVAMRIVVENVPVCDQTATNVRVRVQSCSPVFPDCSVADPRVTMLTSFSTVPDVGCPDFKFSTTTIDYTVSPCFPCGETTRFQITILCDQPECADRKVDHYETVGSGELDLCRVLTPAGHKCTNGTVGACCLGGPVPCTECREADCQPPFGVYRGDGSACATTNCSGGTGACCVGTSCTVGPPSECQSGSYQGDGTNCLPANPCCDPAAIGPLQLLRVTRRPSAADVELTWSPDPQAMSGYNVWYVPQKGQIQANGATSPPSQPVAGCQPTGSQAATTCNHLGAVPGTPGQVYFYNVIGVCRGQEGAR